MRKRKTPQYENGEDDEDDDEPQEPEEFQDSGDDWDPDQEQEPAAGRGAGRKRTGKGKASANTKKFKNAQPSSSEAEPDDEDEEEEEDDDGDNKSDSSHRDIPKYYHSGNFVLLKSEVKWDGDTVVSSPSDLVIWRIDGKALLQKYIPMEIEGKVYHKCTCSYSGWSVDNRENYYPVTEILDKNPQVETSEVVIALNVQDIIKVKDKQ